MTRAGKTVMLIALSATLLATGGAVAVVETYGIAPRLLGPYLERRASGHHPLIELAGREMNRWLISIDRPAPTGDKRYPQWAGAQSGGSHSPTLVAADGRLVTVASPEEAMRAFGAALPGDVIEFAPGTYRFRGGALSIDRPGQIDRPIVVRSPTLGAAVLEFDLLEGFHVTTPYWVFENLVIRGVCEQHDRCEHAFHIVGAARGIIVRNSELRDLNAHVKINGANGRFPDAGRLERNTIVNSSARMTDNPVTLIDLVAASDWLVERNLIADFVKAGADGISDGAFAKGAGRGNRFIANTVLCEHRLSGAAGRRVGLSFGGGGSQAPACRDGRCVVEHEAGLMQSNLIASCSDVGIYINRSSQTQLVHNTLLDTAGIWVRFPESSAVAQRNLVDGGLIARDGAVFESMDDRASLFSMAFLGSHPVRSLFVDSGGLDLRWRNGAPRVGVLGAAIAGLCSVSREPRTAYGAFDDFGSCLQRRASVPQ